MKNSDEKEQVLKLSYEVILSSARYAYEPRINEDEAAAYQELIELLGLPPEVVSRIEAEVEEISGV